MASELTEFISENVVILANRFNLSIFNQYWLIDNGIIDQEDLKAGYTFTPVLNQIQTQDYQLTIVPDRLQLDIHPVTDENAVDLIESKIGKIIEKLPHTPYTALGLNFVYLYTPDADNFPKYTRSIFLNPESPLSIKFTDENARFGGYFIKDMLDFRVMLNARPVTTPSKGDQMIDKINFDFNFHLDLKDEEKHKTILEYLKKWNELKEITEDIMRSFDNV